MPQITISRSGVLTTVTATCVSEHEAEMVRDIMRRGTSNFTTQPGLVLSVRCNKREAAIIERGIIALNKASEVRVPSFKKPDSASGRSWRHREVYAADCMIEAVPKTVTINSRVLKFTGFGKPFIGGELQGPYCGDFCKYAYYA